MQEEVIASAVRTAIGTFGGSLKDIKVTELGKIVIKEALRVADELIIIEDVYTNQLHKYLTFFTDSLFNFEFIGHPHSNKTETEWEKLFKNLKLKIKDKRKDKVLKFYNQVTYYLSKK